MRRFILIAILLSLSMLGAVIAEQYQTVGSALSARLDNIRLQPLADTEPADEEFPATTVISKTFALPFRQASLQVQSLQWNVFDASGNYLYTEQNRALDALSIGNSFTFREMQGFTVLIQTQVTDGNQIRTLTNAEFSLTGSVPIQLPDSVSPAFIDAYKTLADNYQTSYLRDLPVARPKMLIISHSNLTNYQTNFVNWKKSLGFDVYVVNKSAIGTSLDEFKAFILSHYQQYHCDYLLLLGDVSGNYSIPTAFFPSPEYAENDADDHQYTMLEGDDYFPEMLAGRLSFNDISEFMTMANKTITYEKTPFMADTNWMRRNLVVAGNYAEGNLRPTTPKSMSIWLRNKMLDYGYAAVDSVFYPYTYPGTAAIQASINQGVQFISYRGWGDANGWHYPYFHIPDLSPQYINSGPRMSIVYSIVCNTGDFANSVNPSFGEKWMRMGSTAQPNGCVAFVGPSDLHTKTRLNNSISTGAFRSILDYGVRGFAASVLAGKMELYKNFPNDLGTNQYVQFYFHVYNLQADPSLNMWVLVPGSIAESVIEGGLTFAQSDSHIRVNASANEGALVSGSKNGTDFSYAKVQNGFAILPINPDQTGDLTLTVSQPNFVPLVRTLIASEPSGIGVVSNNAAGMVLHPNHTYNAELTLKNFGSASVTVNNLAIGASQNATVNYQHTSFTLAAGATHTINFSVIGSAAIVPREAITITLSSSNPQINQLFQMWGGGAEFTVVDVSGNFPLGQTSPVAFQIMNTGASATTNATVQVVSLSEAAYFPTAPMTLGAIAVGGTATINTNISVAAGAWNGRNLPLKLIFTDSGYSTLTFYTLTAGTAVTTSPTGPDAYGYYAYDSSDAGFAQTPTYQWVETDPLLGGQGTVFSAMDDGSLTVDLPFSFRFYGRDYNQLTMCSNGWISLVPTDMVDFYNCYIPAALGPYAMIAGYWDDLKGMKTGSSPDTFNDMRLIYWYDAANNRYIVQWNDAYNQYNIDLMAGASLEKFQIILYPQTGRDGDIVLQYHTVDNPGTTTNYCTVGIENHTQLVGLQYTHGNVYPPTAAPLAAGLAIKFTTLRPDNFVGNDDQVLNVPFQLAQNYPNPFNPTTTIAFSCKDSGSARLAIFNLKGQLVRTLLNAEIQGGNHNLVWDGTDDNGLGVSSGLYFYRLDFNGSTQTRKMLLLK